MFTAKILLANVLVPVILSTASALTAKFLRRSARDEVDGGQQAVSENRRPLLDVAIGALAAAAAIWLAFGLRNGFAFFPADDAWLRIPTAAILVAVCAVLTVPVPGLIRWVVRLGSLVAASWIVFPAGEAWEFLLPSRTFWIAALAGCSCIGWLGIESRSARESGILALSWIPCFAATAFLTAQSFMKVTEPLLAVSSVVGCLGIAGIVSRRSELLLGAAGPCLLTSAAAAANAQFNSYLGLSDWLTCLAMFSPAIVAVCGMPFLSQPTSSQTGSSTIHLGAFATVIASLAVAIAIVVWTVVVAGGGEEEW